MRPRAEAQGAVNKKQDGRLKNAADTVMVGPVNRKTILVVDDDAVTREVVTRLMQSEGFNVIACSNGPKAVHESLTAKPDLLILDLMMPSPDPAICEVFDGYSVLSWLKTVPSLQGIPVVVLSAKPAAENKQITLEAGAAAYIQKPFERVKLVSAVRIALDSGQDEDPPKKPVNTLAELERLFGDRVRVNDTNWRAETPQPPGVRPRLRPRKQ